MPLRDAKHLSHIRSLICVKCGTNQNIQAAHISKFSCRGIGIKAADDRVIPLCDKCHREQHDKGEVTFHGGIEGVYDAIDLAKALYGTDIFKARRLIMDYRKERL